MTPAAWLEVPIGALYQRRSETDRPELPMLSVYRDLGVVLREGRDDNFNKPGEDLGACQVVRPGDLVLNKMKTWQGSLGISSFEGIVSPAYFVAGQVGDVEPRFMHHLLRSGQLIAEYGARSKGIRPNQWDLPWEEFRTIRVRLPGAGEQQSIADYLDAETARIDQLIEKRQRSVALLDDRADVLTSIALDNPAWPRVPLKWVTRSTVGIVIRPSELYVDAGVPCVRGFNVSRGMVSADDIVFISVEANETNAKSRLRAGDVVVVRTGNAGAAAVVPGWLDGGNCVDLLIVRRTVALLPRFLETVLNSDVVRRQIEQQSVGALQAHFNTESLASLRIPVPDMTTQGAVVRKLDSELEEVGRLQSLHRRNVVLLRERRQALITAAVTGQIEIPGVAA